MKYILFNYFFTHFCLIAGPPEWQKSGWARFKIGSSIQEYFVFQTNCYEKNQKFCQNLVIGKSLRPYKFQLPSINLMIKGDHWDKMLQIPTRIIFQNSPRTTLPFVFQTEIPTEKVGKYHKKSSALSFNFNFQSEFRWRSRLDQLNKGHKRSWLQLFLQHNVWLYPDLIDLIPEFRLKKANYFIFLVYISNQ